MNDELMRKISDAIDSEDGLAGDPELVQLLATSPEAARYAKHLSRMQRWLAAWPIRDPSEAELEGLAANIDARLGEKFSGDYTRAPDFEEDEELASVTSGLLQPGDLEADASSSFDLTMSAITELADHVNEQASAQPVARVPLRKGAVPPPRGALAPTTDDDDLPAALPKAKLPKVPAPRAGATTVLGNPTATAKASDDVAESPAAPKKSDEAHAAHHEPPTPPPAAKKSDEAHAAHHEPPPPPPAAKKSDEAHGAHHGPPPPPPASKKGEHEPPPPPPAAKKDAKKGDPKKPDAKKPTKPEAKAPELEDRVSIPIPLTQGPRLELLEGGKSKAPPPREEAKRSWLPAILAAAAIGIGVIGVGSLTMNGAAPTSVQPASAVGGVSPAATQSTPVVSPTQSPSQDEVGLGQGMAEAAVAEPAPPLAVAPAAPVTPGGADPSAVAPTTAASSTTGLMGGGGASRGQPEASRVSAEGSDWGPQGGPARRAAPRGAAAHSDGEGRGGGGDTPSTGASRGSIDDSVSGGGGTGGRTASQGSSPSARGTGAASGGGSAPPATSASGAASTTRTSEREGAHAPAEARASSSEPVGETLDRATVVSVMQSVEPAVRACAGERHGTAQVDVVVQGSGRVTSATVSGNFQGSPEGSCIARAVRTARFPAFTGEALRFRYPFGI